MFIVSALRARLFSRVAPPTRIHSLRFRPTLSPLEARDIPATFWWNPTVSNDAGNPENWVRDGGLNTLPGPADDVLFVYEYESPDCVGLAGQFGSLTIGWGGYNGTVTFGGPVTVTEFFMETGAIAQPSGADLTVTTHMSWWGGVLNSGSNLSTVHIQGSASISPQDGTGSATTGSTLSFEGGGTFYPGTVTFNNGADIDVLGENSEVLIYPFSQQPVVFQNANPEQQSQITVAAGKLEQGTGTFTSDSPIKVTGGTYLLHADAKATISGSVDGVAGGESVRVTSGSLAICNGATLTAASGVKLTGGRLSTLPGSMFTADFPLPAVIVGDVTNTGADIILLDGWSPRNYYGYLRIDGHFTWTGGTYRPVVYGPQGGLFKADLIKAEDFTTNANATIAPQVAGQNGVVDNQLSPAAGQQWTVIQSDTKIDGVPSLAWPSGFTRFIQDDVKVVLEKYVPGSPPDL